LHESARSSRKKSEKRANRLRRAVLMGLSAAGTNNTTLTGIEAPSGHAPRVARASQPWAAKSSAAFNSAVFHPTDSRKTKLRSRRWTRDLLVPIRDDGLAVSADESLKSRWRNRGASLLHFCPVNVLQQVVEVGFGFFRLPGVRVRGVL
jgi:hypothetical protein